jgi:hypothetical protein
MAWAGWYRILQISPLALGDESGTAFLDVPDDFNSNRGMAVLRALADNAQGNADPPILSPERAARCA